MDELERRIYVQQCNALARGDLELYEVLKDAHEVAAQRPTQIKVIINRGCVHDILVSASTSCSAEVVYIDPDEDDYKEMLKRRDEVCSDPTLVSVDY
jgi:hypothetical protein